MMRFVIGVAALLAAQGAAAQTPAIDLAAWKGRQAGPPSEVLTLGSAHLGQMDAKVTSAMLAPLLDKLAAFQPQVITYEGLSGAQCEDLRRFPLTYPGVWDSYCWPLDDAQKAVGLDLPAATAEIAKQLASWPAAPSAEQRRHLAALFVAAGDRPSARVQWLQLPPDERRTGDGVDEALLKILTPKDGEGEHYAIAAALAARLGLQRVYPVDDHTADAVQAEAPAGLDEAMMAIWKGTADAPIAAENARRGKELASPADILSYYRFLNQPETQRGFVEIDHKRAMETASPQNFGRIYFAWWEVRNLRMVANIRAAFGSKPGARVLNVVGASHKPFYDAYLAQMADVKLVDAQDVLR